MYKINFNLLNSFTGKERSSRNKEIWEASPIVCFENGEIKESSFEVQWFLAHIDILIDSGVSGYIY